MARIIVHRTQRLDAPYSASFGESNIGSVDDTQGANLKEVFPVTVPQNGWVTKLTGYISGNGSGSGAQVMRAVIYADSSGAPGNWLGTSNEVTIFDGQAYAWVDFAFPSPVQIAAGATIWIGYHGGNNGDSAQIKGFSGSGVKFNTDTYTDGASSPFGSPSTSGTKNRYSLYATYQTVAPPPAPPPPPPPVGSFLWGACGSVALSTSGFPNATAARQRELDDMAAVGVVCPRYAVGGSPAVDPLLEASSFPHWIAIVGSSGSTWPSNATFLNYCQAHPRAIIEPINEANCNAVPWTPEDIAAKHIALYSYLRGQGCNNTIVLGSICNSGSSTYGGLTPLQWGQRIAAAGCVPGVGFDWPNYHMYSDNPTQYDAWQHCWTPDGSGHSIQNYFGNPPFIVSEFGFPLSSAGTEAAQATACTAWINKFKSLPNFKGAMWYALSNDAPGTGSGYGLRRSDLTHKPAWDAFFTGVTT